MSPEEDALEQQWRAEAVADASKEKHSAEHKAQGVRYAACGCVITPAAQDRISVLSERLERAEAALKEIYGMPERLRLGQKVGLSQGLFSAQDIAQRALDFSAHPVSGGPGA